MFICRKISNYEDNNCDNNINIYIIKKKIILIIIIKMGIKMIKLK